MEFSLRRSSSRKSSQGSPSSKHHHHQYSSSCDYSQHLSSSGHESPTTNITTLPEHHRHHTYDVANFSNQSNYSPSHGQGEVIVKIDSTTDGDDSSGTTTITRKFKSNDGGNNSMWRRGSSGEFSFPRPNNDDEGDDHDRDEGNENNELSRYENLVPRLKRPPALEPQKETRELMLDVDLENEQSQHQSSPSQKNQEIPHHRRLPPIPPNSYLNRNQIDIQSPDHTNCHKTSSIHQDHNLTHNYEGFRETRVSFQESLNSEQVRHETSIYNSIEGESSSSWNSSTSTVAEDDKDQNHSGSILKCSPKSLTRIRKLPSMSISRAKSRLADPQYTPLDQQLGGMQRSGPIMKSGLMGKSMVDEEEDDPFLDDDLPGEFRVNKMSTIVILEWAGLVMIVGVLTCSLIIPVLRRKIVWNLKLWKWEVLVLVLICGRLVSDWGIRILVFLIERNFLLRKRVLYFVYGLKKPVQNVIWLGLVLVTWHLLFDKKVELESKSKPVKVVTKLLLIGETSAVLWLLKTFLVKVCASTFHVKAFFDRIQESLFNQFVIETLSGPPIYEFKHVQEDEARTIAEVESLQNAGIDVPHDLQESVLQREKSDRSVQPPLNEKPMGVGGTPYKSPIGHSTRYLEPLSKKQNEGITVDHLHKLNQKNISAWNMKRLMRIIRHGTLTTLDEQIVDANNLDDEHATHILSETEAKAAAKKIFRNVTRHQSGVKYIYLQDILRFMLEEEALRTLSLFEGGIESQMISKAALKNWVVNAFRERRALALTLSDTKTAVNKLHKMANFIVSIIILIIAVTWLNIIRTESVFFLSSQLVVAAFVFGNTCKNIFESIIFLFVIHPFDVGDRCEIDGVQMVVEEMNILTTVFLRYDNLKIIFPNYILLTKPISNFKRSPEMGDAVEFCFHISTPTEKIAVIRHRILSYIENKKEHWLPSPMIILKDVEHLHMLRIAVWLAHRMNHQDMGERWVRRALLVEECIKIFKEMDIDYRVYPVNVNVNSVPPLSYVNAPSKANNVLLSEAGKDTVHF